MTLRSIGPSIHPILLTGLGVTLIMISLVSYQTVSSSSPIGPENISSLQQLATLGLLILALGLIIAFTGATIYLRERGNSGRTDNEFHTRNILSSAMSDRTAFLTFLGSGLLYGVFFSFVSSIVIYRPFGPFVETQATTAPSVLTVVCCGPLGQMPQFVVFISQSLAVLIIPVNLILLFAVSWMVGLNSAIALFSYRAGSRSRSGFWLGGTGAIVSLFTACPTCAGFFLLTLMGLASAVPVALTLASVQTLFIVAGFPILIIAPILSAKRAGIGHEACMRLSAPDPMGSSNRSS